MILTALFLHSIILTYQVQGYLSRYLDDPGKSDKVCQKPPTVKEVLLY